MISISPAGFGYAGLKVRPAVISFPSIFFFLSFFSWTCRASPWRGRIKTASSTLINNNYSPFPTYNLPKKHYLCLFSCDCHPEQDPKNYNHQENNKYNNYQPLLTSKTIKMETIRRIWEWIKDNSMVIVFFGFLALTLAIGFAFAYLLVDPFHVSGILEYAIIIAIGLSLFLPALSIIGFPSLLLFLRKSSIWKQLKTEPQIVNNQFLSFIKDNAIIFSLLFIYILFYRFWESWIGNHIIQPFFSHFESNLLNDLIFIFITISCLVLIHVKTLNANYRRKKIKQQTLILSIITMGFWAYYRFHQGLCGMDKSPFYLQFIPLSKLNPIKYFDILFVLASYNISSYWTWKAFSGSTSVLKFDATRGLTRNLPISEKDDDFLERNKLANSVVKELLITDASKGAFTYGIDAPWGSGKTSFIILMKNRLKSNPESHHIIMDFNPWSYAADKDLVTAFFEELSKTLRQHDASLAKNLIDYSQLLSAFDTTETKLISSLLELARHDDSSLQDKKQQITEAIKRINQRIFVFIDDIDRLESNEILEMMKLIRNVSDFPYMYIIAAYDKSYVVKCLSTKMKFGATNFVEKIFEHEHILAPCSNESLRRSLVTQLALIHNGGFLKPALEEYILDNNNKALNALSNLREIYRLSNNIASADSLLNHENVYSIDLLLFGLFKTKYPVAFSLFEHKWHEVLVEDNHHKYYQLFQEQDEDGHFNFIKYLESHPDEMCLNEFDIKTIRMVLSELFMHQQDADEKVPRLNHIKWFSRYLNLTQLVSDINENDFYEVMKKSIDEIKKAIDVWSIDKSASLKYRLLNYGKGKRLGYRQLKKHIEVFIYACIKNKWRYSDLNLIIYHLKKFNSDTFFEYNQAFITSVLAKYGDSDFIKKYIRHLYEKKEYKQMPISENDLIEIQQSIFDDCCKKDQNRQTEISDVFACFHYLLGIDYDQYTTEIESIKHDRFTKSLLNEMKKYVETNKGGFLQSIISSKKIGDYRRAYRLLPFVQYLWGSWRGFRKFLSTLDDSDPFYQEFKDFFKQYRKNHYKWTQYDFKIIEPPL